VTEEKKEMIDYRIESFIGIFDNALSDSECDALVNYYETMEQAGVSYSRQKVENVPESMKKDNAIFLHEPDAMQCHYINLGHMQAINTALGDCYKIYQEMYSAIDSNEYISPYYIKIQKTHQCGGYHVWHCENSSINSSRRSLVWSCYLNDVAEGGETEFLYLSKRVKPKKGTMLIWPAGFTHTHRGNPPLSNTKYLATGWFEYTGIKKN